MSDDIEARIAEVLREHWYIGKEEWACLGCGEDFHKVPRPQDHLAAVLVKGLGLKRETRWVPVGSNGHRWAPHSTASSAQNVINQYGEHGTLRSDFPDFVDRIEQVSRYTTNWSKI